MLPLNMNGSSADDRSKPRQAACDPEQTFESPIALPRSGRSCLPLPERVRTSRQLVSRSRRQSANWHRTRSGDCDGLDGVVRSSPLECQSPPKLVAERSRQGLQLHAETGRSPVGTSTCQSHTALLRGSIRLAESPLNLRRTIPTSGLFAVYRQLPHQALMVAVLLVLMGQPLHGNHK